MGFAHREGEEDDYLRAFSLELSLEEAETFLHSFQWIVERARNKEGGTP